MVATTILSDRSRGIAAVLLNNVLLGLAVGMFLPFTPLRLHEAGISAGLIGLNVAAASVATLVIAPSDCQHSEAHRLSGCHRVGPPASLRLPWPA